MAGQDVLELLAYGSAQSIPICFSALLTRNHFVGVGSPNGSEILNKSQECFSLINF